MRILTALLLFVASSLHAANLIPNSSFETGSGRGWYVYGTGNDTYKGEDGATSYWLTNGGAHGGYSIVLKEGARLVSRAIYLTAGNYRLTFYSRCLVGIQGSYFSGVMNPHDMYQGATPNSFSVTNTFLRFTNSFTADSNAFYFVKIYNISQPTILVDALQLEAGTTPTAYAPMATVECGLSTAMTNNMFFSGDTREFKLNFWNDGSAVSSRVRYQIFDTWNSNVVTADISVNLAAATNTTTTVSLPARTGWFRATSRLAVVNDSYDEMPYVVYPFAYDIAKGKNSTNAWLGGHPLISAYDTRKELMSGKKWARLGPGGRAVRWSLVEPSRDVYDWSDDGITNNLARDMNIVGILCDFPDGSWPTWATNANGTADLVAFANYCSNVVFRYKPWINHWEVWNEPYQSGVYTNRTGNSGAQLADSQNGFDYTGTNLPITVRVASNYVKIVNAAIPAITNADPTARIIIMAGAFGNPGLNANAANGDLWDHYVWTNLTADIQSWVYAVSTHIYPKTHDPNIADEENFTVSYGWMDTWRGVRNVWNSEAGVYYNAGSTVKGLNGLFPPHVSANGEYRGAFDVYLAGSATSEPYRNDASARQLTSTMRNVGEALRCIGIGFYKYLFYNTVPINDEMHAQSVPYSWDPWQVERPENIGLSVAQSMVRAPGFGRVTNAIGGPYVFEAYMFTNGNGNPVVAAWNMDRTNRTLTCSSTFFEVLDCMGNFIQTNAAVVKISRMPVYIRSGTLSMTDLSNTVGSAVAANVMDALPPQLSFDIAPSGLWDGSTNATLIKWTPIDDTFSVAIAGSPSTLITSTETNVMCRWSLDGAPYTSNTQSNHFWPHHLSAGNHSLSVQAFDRNGNSATYTYDFVPPETTLNCSATFNVGSVIQPSP